MMGKFSRSWRLMKASWEILKKDKEIMLLPVISGVTLVVVLISFAVPLFFAGDASLFRRMQAEGDTVLQFAFGVFFYFITYLIILFFNAAIVACASIRMRGGDPTVTDGLQVAWARLPLIAGWALLAATVGMLLRLVEERFELAGRLVAGLLGMAWSITSFLVIPVLVIERRNPIDAFKDSAALLRQTWGEQIITTFSFGLIFFVLMLPAIVLIVLALSTGAGTAMAAMIAAAVVYMLALAAIQSALQGIFQAALYEFARSGAVPEGFEHDLLSGAVARKKA